LVLLLIARLVAAQEGHNTPHPTKPFWGSGGGAAAAAAFKSSLEELTDSKTFERSLFRYFIQHYPAQALIIVQCQSKILKWERNPCVTRE
jgi:hypothetical protein